MNVSSSTDSNMGAVQVEALKKSIDVTQRDALKVLESVTEQSQQMAAQKTGIGVNLNIKS